MPAAWGGVCVERRTALVVNHREIRNLEKLRRSGALQGAFR